MCLNSFMPTDTGESFVVTLWHFNDCEKPNSEILSDRRISPEIAALNKDILSR